MHLDEVTSILTGSTPADWNHEFDPTFPTYQVDVSPLTDGDPVGVHHGIAVYRPDVRLSIAWGMEPPTDSNPMEGLWRAWAEGFSGTVTSFLLDVFYCNALVDRYVGASVDHAYLPFPRPHGMADFGDYIGNENPPPITWSVTRTQVAVFRLVHSMDHGVDNYDQIVERAGFVVDSTS